MTRLIEPPSRKGWAILSNFRETPAQRHQTEGGVSLLQSNHENAEAIFMRWRTHGFVAASPGELAAPTIGKNGIAAYSAYGMNSR